MDLTHTTLIARQPAAAALMLGTVGAAGLRKRSVGAILHTLRVRNLMTSCFRPPCCHTHMNLSTGQALANLRRCKTEQYTS